MKIGIIGCGYVGSAVAKKLKSKSHHITVTTTSPEKVKTLKEFADDVILIQEDTLQRLAETCDAIILSVAPKKPNSYEETYLNTAKQLAKTEIKTLIYTGSTSVYGDHNGEWVTEVTPAAPDTPQSEILLETEKTLQAERLVIFRLGQIIGPGKEMRKFDTLPGTGEQYSNRIHLDDIVSAIEFALETPISGIYNLCHDEHLKRRELMPEVTWDPTRKSIHAGNKRVSNKKIKEAGFHFKHPTG